MLGPNIGQRLRIGKNDDVEDRVLGLRTRQGDQHRQQQGKADGVKNAGVKQEQRHIASFLFFHRQKSKMFQVARR
jgi:hypothetical protein